MKRMNKNQGITLIALVVTIVVLLILAGMSIAALTGENGILNRATEAKQTNEQKTAEEKLKLGVSALSIDYRKNTTNAQTFKQFITANNGENLKDAMGLTGDDRNQLTANSENGIVTYKGTTYRVTDDGKIGEATPVTVTFNVNGGTFAQNETGTRTGIIGEAITLPTAPTAATEGNVFRGWYTAASEGKVVYRKTEASPEYPEKDTIVYAHYGPNVATVDEVGDGTETVYYNGSVNWEKFFVDNGRTYLIYKGANAYESLNARIIDSKNWSKIYSSKNTYYPTTTGGTTDEIHTHLTDYLVKTADSNRFKPATQAGWLEKYMTWLGDGTENFSDAGNMAFTLFMLDQNVWKYGIVTPGDSPTSTTDYYDSSVADWVIGGPTMEMMVATANTLYTSQTNSCSVTRANGYSISGLGSNNTLPAESVLNHTSGSNYHYYWVASPYYGNGDYAWIMHGGCSSLGTYYYSSDGGFRPVVCLKSGVSLTTEGASTHNTTYVLKTQ